MFVGVARITLSIPGARSLKDRRRVVKSLKDRLRARLSVSVAEVGNVELHQLSTLGVAVLSSDSGRCSMVLGQAVSMARVQRDALLTFPRLPQHADMERHAFLRSGCTPRAPRRCYQQRRVRKPTRPNLTSCRAAPAAT